MNVRHPAPDELLLDHACGAAAPGKSLLVLTHVAMCEEARVRLALLEEIGGAILETVGGRGLSRVTVDGVLAALNDRPRAQDRRDRQAMAGREPVKVDGIALPGPLAAYAGTIADRRSWRRLGVGVEAAELPVSTPEAKTQLLRARPGVKILEHTHLGEEAVLLVNGAFYDQGERYGAGDVAVSDCATTHAPVIADEDVCLCLAVTEGPVRFVGRAGWLLNLFNRF